MAKPAELSPPMGTDSRRTITYKNTGKLYELFSWPYLKEAPAGTRALSSGAEGMHRSH
jgi:uncharacterized protein (DUF39 family)